MKKMMLGVLALSSMASLAAGYVRTNSEAKIYNDKLTTEGIKTLSYEVKPNLELGVLFGENKEGFIFAGGQLNIKKDTNTAANYYLGSRIDTDVAENTNLKLTFLYDKQEKDKDKKFIERLKEQGKWDNKLKTDDEKENHLYLNGYKLFDKNNTLLISSVLSGKYEEYLGENLEYHVGAIYGSKDFTNNTFESFAKAKVNFAKYNLEGNLTSTLGTYKRYKINEKKYQLIEEKDVKSGNLANGGRLSADLKVSSDKLVDKLTLSAKGSTTLDTVLLDNKQQLIKAGLETEAKYKLDAVELKANLNYGTEVINKKTPTEVKLLHKPKVVLGAKYTGVENLMLSTELSDEVFIKQEVKTPVAKKDIANKFVVKNTAEYELLKGVKLGAIANYKLETTFDNVAHKHMVVAGPHLNVKIEDEVKKVNSETRLRYALEHGKTVDHYVGLYNETKGEYKLNDTVKLEGKLIADSLNKINKNQPNPTIFSMSYIEPEMKVSYEKDRFSALANANEKLSLIYSKQDKLSMLVLSNVAKIVSEIGYKVVDNVKVMGGLELTHVYLADQKENNKELHSLVKKLDDFKFTSDKFAVPLLENMHTLNVTPSVSAKISLVNDKLTIEPKLEAGINFASKALYDDAVQYQENKLNFVNKFYKPGKFGLNSVEGKASLKVEYKW